MHTGQSSQVVLRFWVGSASDNSESLSEQANEDLGNFLDDLHSRPPYSDMLEVPESSDRPAHNHLPEFDDEEMESDWYEWGLGTPHSSDSDYGDEVVQIPSDQYVSVEDVRNYDWDGFLRWRASRQRRATQRSARTVQAQTGSARSPANHRVPVTAGTHGITDEQGSKDKVLCTPRTLDTCDSPRPLRDPCAPRPEGSSINGYYGNDAGKSFNTSTAASQASTESNAVASRTPEQRNRS